MNAIRMKAELAAYWRFIRQMPIVAVEALAEDVLVTSKDRRLIICEIKVSVSDMRVERAKVKHAIIRHYLGMNLLPQQSHHEWILSRKADYSAKLSIVAYPNAFYFAVPVEILDKAKAVREEFFPYAGLIVVKESRRQFLGHRVEVVIPAKELHKRKATMRDLSHIVKAQSASLANSYARLAKDSQ